MLRTSDVMAAKIAVQLQVVGEDDARSLLRAIDGGQPGGDFVNLAAARFRLDPRLVETVRHRAALYEHVREEAVYLRLIERALGIGRSSVATLLAQLEAQAHRRRLGDALVRAGRLSAEKDKELLRQARASIQQDDGRILDRYRQEDFAGVKKPLIRGSTLDPSDFKISTLFRSKETRALVDQIDLQALREEARRAAAERDAARGEPAAPAPAPASEPAAPAPDERAPLSGMEQVSRLKRIADYTVVEVLGVGGMGAVFLGQKDGRGEYCAIKVMLNQAAGKTEMGRFRREIALMRQIDHPNVLALLDSGETPEGLTYLVVPALAGKELRAHLEAAGGAGLALPFAIKVFKQVLEGLAAAHARHIVHRDLKPENIFVRAGGEEEVKIMDFGLARLGDDVDQGGQEDCFRSDAGEVVGSPAYIAPESITNDAIDARTDIYSLGIILFEMLTGKLPLESETAQGYLGQHLVCPPLTLAEAQPDRRWPQAAEDLVARMMGKTKDERPATCAEVLEAFKAVVVPLLRMDASSKEVPTIAPIEVAAAQAAAAQPRPEPARWGFKGLMGRLLRRD
ncbi:MAG: serine/threonine protein kinase [Planctomycetes bacterium]|nr:serine/threonine protein kinase [Planctomycetota bacterium]